MYHACLYHAVEENNFPPKKRKKKFVNCTTDKLSDILSVFYFNADLLGGLMQSLNWKGPIKNKNIDIIR